MSGTDTIRVPEPIWTEFIARHGGKFFTVALRLADGRELEDIRVNDRGVVVGTLFDDTELPPIQSSDIVGIRSVLSPWFT
jgi:hypothetical protein